MPRIFIAIPISSQLQTVLGQVKAPSESGVRWVAPRNLHLTLRFLGDISEEQLSRVCLATAKAAQEGPSPFTLSIKGVGAFPSSHHARVLWAGLTGNQKPLIQLHEILQDHLHIAGFPPEKRPFRPHITLARFRNPAPLSPRLNALGSHQFGRWQISELQVIESRLRPAGAEYEVRQRYELN